MALIVKRNYPWTLRYTWLSSPPRNGVVEAPSYGDLDARYFDDEYKGTDSLIAAAYDLPQPSKEDVPSPRAVCLCNSSLFRNSTTPTLSLTWLFRQNFTCDPDQQVLVGAAFKLKSETHRVDPWDFFPSKSEPLRSLNSHGAKAYVIVSQTDWF